MNPRPIYALLFTREARYGWSVVPKAELFRFTSMEEYHRALLSSISISTDWLLEHVPKDKGSFRHWLRKPVFACPKMERRLRYQVTHWADELQKW